MSSWVALVGVDGGGESGLIGEDGAIELRRAGPSIEPFVIDNGRLITWADVARIMSADPARIARIPGQGRPIAVGEPANLVLVNPQARRIVVPEEHQSKGRNSPYRGLELPGRVMATVWEGHPTVLDGRMATPRTPEAEGARA